MEEKTQTKTPTGGGWPMEAAAGDAGPGKTAGEFNDVAKVRMDAEGGRKMYDIYMRMRYAEKDLRCELARAVGDEAAAAIVERHLYRRVGAVQLRYLFYMLYMLSDFMEGNHDREMEDLEAWVRYRHGEGKTTTENSDGYGK